MDRTKVMEQARLSQAVAVKGQAGEWRIVGQGGDPQFHKSFGKVNSPDLPTLGEYVLWASRQGFVPTNAPTIKTEPRLIEPLQVQGYVINFAPAFGGDTTLADITGVRKGGQPVIDGEAEKPPLSRPPGW